MMKMAVAPIVSDGESISDYMALNVSVSIVYPRAIPPDFQALDVDELSKYVGFRARRGIRESLETAYEEFVEGSPPIG